MLLSEMIEHIDSLHGDRLQVKASRIMSAISEAQCYAFSRDIDAFLAFSKISISGSYKGPYSFPSDSRCVALVCSVPAGRTPYVGGFDKVDAVLDQVIGRAATLVDGPESSADYYFRYYRRPAALSLQTDALVMPDEWHQCLVSCAIAILDPENKGQAVPTILDSLLSDFWLSMSNLRRGCIRKASRGSF